MDHFTPVVILRSGHHGGLGIVRSLGRLRVPVYCVDAYRWEPAFSSRYCRGRFLLDTRDGEAMVGRLLEIGRQVGGRPILIPTTDRGANWVADNAAALHDRYLFPVQDATLTRTLSDKGTMQDLARQNGVPVAQAVVPRSAEDLDRFLETAVFPLMMKATDAERMRSRIGATKLLAHSRDELFALFTRSLDGKGPNLLVQEYIPGEDWMFDGYFDDHSECLFGVTGKKIRRLPVDTGVTSLGVCARNEIVARTTVEFMRAIGYRGILDIGYRRDQRDGQYKVLDVNPRIGCTFRLFAGSGGLDVARALYLDLTGQAVPREHAAEGRKWIVEDFDLLSALRSWKSGALTLQEWVRSLRSIDEAACFAWDDPLPLLLMAAADCGELREWSRSRKESQSHLEPAIVPE